MIGRWLDNVIHQISEVFRTPGVFDWLSREASKVLESDQLGFLAAMVGVFVIGVVVYLLRRKR
jgi:hypothetical protein